jgi:hypothetical protein
MLVLLPPAPRPLYQVARWGYIIVISLVIQHITTKTTQPLFITIKDIYCKITWYIIIANEVTEELVVAYLKQHTWSKNKRQKEKYKANYKHNVWMRN